MLLQPLHNETILLEQISRGCETAFRTLYDAYSGGIYKVALQHLKQTHLAEDIVQVVFLKVWEQRDSLKNIRQFSSWLFILCRNNIVNHLRKQGTQETYRNYVKCQMEGSAETPETAYIKRDLQFLLQQAISELSPQQRIAFQLQRNEDLSYEDIGQRMGIATNTVKVHLYKAHQQLRNYLSLHGVDTVAISLIFMAW